MFKHQLSFDRVNHMNKLNSINITYFIYTLYTNLYDVDSVQPFCFVFVVVIMMCCPVLKY